jgi:hypothetical protein
MSNLELRNYIKSIPKIVVNPETIVDKTENIGIITDGEQPMSVTKLEKTITRIFDEVILFDPNVSNLFPGNLIQSKYALTGNLTRLPGKRAPITITLVGLMSSDPLTVYSKDITDPKLSSFQTAYAQLLTQQFDYSVPAMFSYYGSQFETTEQAALTIGASAKWMSGEVATKLMSKTSAETSNLIVRFVQKYFTISIDEVDQPEDFFDPQVVSDDIKDGATIDNPPLYISDVHYGRELTIIFSIEKQKSSVLDVLNASFSAFAASGSIAISSDEENALKSTKTMIMVKGGDPSLALKIIDGDTLQDKKAFMLQYLQAGATYSHISQPSPISYVTKYIADGTLFSVNSSAVFESTSSTPILCLKSVHVHFHTGGDDKDKDESVEVWLYQGPNTVGHINVGGGQKWDDHTDQNFDIDIRPMVMVNQQLNFRLRKNPDNDSGSGWRMTMEVTGKFTDGTQKTLILWPSERIVGDGNQYDFTQAIATNW